MLERNHPLAPETKPAPVAKKDEWTTGVKKGKGLVAAKASSLPMDHGNPSSSQILSDSSVPLLPPPLVSNLGGQGIVGVPSSDLCPLWTRVPQVASMIAQQKFVGLAAQMAARSFLTMGRNFRGSWLLVTPLLSLPFFA